MILFCVILLVPRATLISYANTPSLSAEELLGKIVSSEKAIHDAQAECIFFEPDTNMPLMYFHWGYEGGKEFIAGIRFSRAEDNRGYKASDKSKYSLNGKQHSYHFREEMQSGLKQGGIGPLSLFDSDRFRMYMTPNSLLGFDVTCGIRQSFGQALKEARKTMLRKKPEEIDGHSCLVLEAIGIEDTERTLDVRSWIDTSRDFRPLKVEIFYSTDVNEEYERFTKIFRKIYDIKLKKINGIWFPIEGRRDTFSTREILPNELKGMTEEQAVHRFSQEELKGLAQKIRYEQVLSVPTRKLQVDMASVKINQGIPPEKFVIKFPPGCEVWDNIRNTKYIVGSQDYAGEDVSPVDIRLSGLKRFAPAALMDMIYPDSLIGISLPDLEHLQINIEDEQIKGKMILVCFWDMEQRPSRNCIIQLARQAEQLKEKGVTIVAIQSAKIDQTALNDWVKKYNIPFAVGMIAGDEEKTRFEWRVKSLPWLILTDRKHIVRAEGFGLSELDEKIKQVSGE
jgi:hypothetical protein